MKKTLLTLAALAVAAPVATVPAAAVDLGTYASTGHEISVTQTSEYRRRDYNRGYRDGYQGRVWRDDRGRYRCKRDDGTTGLLIGAGVGGLAGHEIAGRGDKTLGVVLGAAGGALIGREIDRRGSRCR